jgi:hypothetical protein
MQRNWAMRWKERISNPWMVLVFAIVGGPSTLEDARKWVEVLGVNVLTTLALMGLAAHITAVGFRDWEPYRGWLRRLWLRLRPQTVHVRWGVKPEQRDTQWQERALASGTEIHGLDFVGPKRGESVQLIVEIPDTHHIRFIEDPNHWFWTHIAGDGTRRYTVGPLPYYPEHHASASVTVAEGDAP